MRLSKIKLAGFKSFVDPTTFFLPSNLVGVVGPNGCGKSNVIDAVRWVLGESSAKNLRGDSMADVIFNGSASRKPVGAASIELCFDNAGGVIGGQYASYAEISVKRSIGRDGTSLYFLNNVRCRRKDITDIFLGTGLGPRSYSIIEQGTVSRFIEAKPEDMRVYIEEAAGISKYKERRRDTEGRIKDTRENLSRLNDLRDEIRRQIEYLQRQAKAAERYKELRQQQRALEGELLAIKLTDLDRVLDEERLNLARRTTQLEATLAARQSIDTQITSVRELHVAASENFNGVQARYYVTQAEIAQLEQAIAHARDTRERQQWDLAKTREQVGEVETALAAEQLRIAELDDRFAEIEPERVALTASEQAGITQVREAENALATWRAEWHRLNLQIKEAEQVIQVEQTNIEHMQVQIASLRRQSEALDREQQGASAENLQERLTGQVQTERVTAQSLQKISGRLQEIDAESRALKSAEQQANAEYDLVRGKLAALGGQLSALEALQSAALGSNENDAQQWLQAHGLTDQSRLVRRLRIEERWARAVETVLGDFLQAVCVKHCDPYFADLPDARIMMIQDDDGEQEKTDSASLLSKVSNAGRASRLLAAVRVAETLEEALRIQAGLHGEGSVITADGIWLGPGWIRVSRGQKSEQGLLTREHEIRTLKDKITGDEVMSVQLESRRQECRQKLTGLETLREECVAELNQANRAHAEAATVLEGLQAQQARALDRDTVIKRDAEELRDNIERVRVALMGCADRRTEAEFALASLQERVPDMEERQTELNQGLERERHALDETRVLVGRLTVEYESRRVAREGAASNLQRLIAQQSQLSTQAKDIAQLLIDAELPFAEAQQQLDQALENKVAVERELTGARETLEATDAEMRTADLRRNEAEKAVTGAREGVEALRMAVRETEVRREGLVEKFSDTGVSEEEAKKQLPEQADADQWQQKLDAVTGKIERLGPINLAAIDQFNEQSERQKYLDAQHADLSSALDTLEQAIRKIDRETRTRFQETFDHINLSLKRIFPRLFGGGHAYLSLEGDDIASAGVTVMARPPGKRNSHIHLLSGGEKALTAVSLIFSIFELNPSPFCLLDEVDAPLDEANLGRFCEIVREMSQKIQFLVITHNKTTMEMTKQLTGVTMSEPGVSRLVSVDLDEAVQLAAS